jgi:hypothetical protein
MFLTSKQQATVAAIDIRAGDLITDQVRNERVLIEYKTIIQVDAIVVCSTSDRLVEAVLNAAGSNVKKAFQTAKHDNQDQNTVLSAGKLLCKRIICIPWKPKKLPGLSLENSVRNFVITAMDLASRERCTTLAFPALGKQRSHLSTCASKINSFKIAIRRQLARVSYAL